MNADESSPYRPLAVELSMFSCSGIASHSHAHAHRVVEIWPTLGCQFVIETGAKPDANPQRRIKSNGCIIVPLTFKHPCLGIDAGSRYLGHSFGVGELGYIADHDVVSVHQTISPLGGMNELAQGQLNFAMHAYPDLRPTYGWIDAGDVKSASQDVKSASDLRYLFWVNILGPELTREIGAEFLAKCPAHSIRQLNDGGAVVVCTETISQWFANPPQDVLIYLRRKVPKMVIHRAVPED